MTGFYILFTLQVSDELLTLPFLTQNDQTEEFHRVDFLFVCFSLVF